MLQLCDQPVRYDREGTSPQNRLIAACHTTSEELQQLVHEPEICRKEMEAARGSVLSQSWLSTILTHFDQNPEQRTFTRQELELALELAGQTPTARQFANLLKTNADEFEYEVTLRGQRIVSVVVPARPTKEARVSPPASHPTSPPEEDEVES